MLWDLVAQGSSTYLRIKNVDGYFFPEQCSCSAKRPAKLEFVQSKKTAMGLSSCHREQVPVPSHKQPEADADSPP